MRVANLDTTNSSHSCPPGTRLRTDPRRLCGSGSIGPGCSSTPFATHGIRYSQVCGKIIGYQYATTDAFGVFDPTERSSNSTVEDNYVDGVSLTHGNNPRVHIWTFAAALDEVGSQPSLNCPCTNVQQAASATPPPNFVGDNYFCDTGSITIAPHNTLHVSDPLWDGAGCGQTNNCCSLNDPPWFLRQLPSTTTDDIEMRLCHEQHTTDEDSPLEVIEIYVR